ncbi:hypothetical protein [Cereibacter sphaeroides]|uniref:hypothetical protein n=1 Tax=Cereibacter sphaeroides TaxID=1063 RepID=UPI001F255376|nr:hypothetical protein [Cereibacter sphaeroides]MCE6951308.1 hypothetical protein [Cereibacter sphaeroides]MCE6970100.1 hypothetical protein [Cereibacter sphaeroides]
MHRLAMTAAALLTASVLPAHAYIGPGVGAGTVAVVLGILASVVMAFLALLWYPVKRVVRKRKASQRTVTSQDARRL